MAEDLQQKIIELARPLSDQQRLFIHEYMIDLNGTKAAVRAGYAEKTAAARASRLLRMPKIKAYRDALMQERFEAIGVDKYNIAMCVWQVYLRCSEKVPVMEWDTNLHEWVESGKWAFDTKGALKALDMLRQMLPEMEKKNGGSEPQGLEALLAGGDDGGRTF